MSALDRTYLRTAALICAAIALVGDWRAAVLIFASAVVAVVIDRVFS